MKRMKRHSLSRLTSNLSACLLGLALMTVGAALNGCSSGHASRSYPADSVEAGMPNPTTPPDAGPYTLGPSPQVPGSIGRAMGAPPATATPAPAPATTDLERIVPPQSLPARGDELWVIEKPDSSAPHLDARDEAPGGGSLVTKNPAGEIVPVPLKHTGVKASIAGYVASVDVTQQFTNPFAEKIEAVYVFPLPHNAAVSEFVMTLGDRHIRGIIRERQEAERIYHAARGQGYVASLLTQERPNVFTQSVANIEPGKQIDIDIRYFGTLAFVDGSFEFVFPMVIGPRFNPPSSTDGIGAVGPGSRGASGQTTEVPYLRPNQRGGHDISVAVSIDAGLPIESIDSRNHKIHVARPGADRAEVTLDADDAIPNKDFVLRYKVAGGKIKNALVVGKNPTDETGFFSLMLIPPDDLKQLPRQPLEMVFVVDVSGSQSGAPLAQEKAATRYCLAHMGPDDTFQVVRFGDAARPIFPRPVPATPANVRTALRELETWEAGGGTMLVDAVHAALLFPADPSRSRYVAFMTDGFIGNEAEALGDIHRCLGNARLFSFGVGSSTNRFLLDHMAKMGRGAVAYLGLGDDADEVMGQYFDRISHPALTDIQIDWGGLQVAEVFPRQIPDLFVGRPVILAGRFTTPGASVPASKIHVKGRVGRETREFDIPVKLDGPVKPEGRDAPEGQTASAKAADARAPDRTAPDTKAPTINALPDVWARMKIADLADEATYQPNEVLPRQIRQVALEYGLMSRFTAFVAVDSLTRTADDHGTRVGVPVPVPDGVRYETTVTEAKGGNAGEAH